MIWEPATVRFDADGSWACVFPEHGGWAVRIVRDDTVVRVKIVVKTEEEARSIADRLMNGSPEPERMVS